jgi:DNA-binding response OmpR family regulator
VRKEGSDLACTTRAVSVAIVNDEASIVELLKWNLEKEGYDARGYPNTAAALGLIEKPADVALLDKANFDGTIAAKLRRRDLPRARLRCWT